MARLALLLALALPLFSAEKPIADEMWASIAPVYAKTLAHPFLKGLTDGTLPRSRFQFYLLQDTRYLRVFGQVLSILASKAPREEWAMTLNDHAKGSIQEERSLHEGILQSFGVSPAAIRETPMAPTNYAYTNHLYAAAVNRPFAQGLAAVLPCYWIYLEVGKELKKKGSKNPDYQRWIDNYSGEEYGKVVDQVLEMMNREAATMSPAARREAMELFQRSARYEWMFWDMAWNEEAWKP